MPKYAKFMKDLVARKGKTEETSQITLNERCFVVLLNKIPFKEKVPGSFTIPCVIGKICIDKSLADLGSSISLMPYSMYARLDLGELKSTALLDMKEDHKILIILERPFLATSHAMIDVFNKKISFKLGNETITFDIEKSMKFSTPEDDECLSVDMVDKVVSDLVHEILLSNLLNSFLFEPIVNYQKENDTNLWEEEDDDSDDLDKSVPPSDHDNWEPIRPTLFATNMFETEKQPPKLKELPSRLEYAFLNNNQEFPAALAWKVADIKGISPSFCTYKILMEHNFKPVVQPQRRLNPKVQDVVKAEIVKLFDSGLIYAILDSPWSPDEGLSGIKYYCFLDGFSGYFQIPLALEDQEKTTFTCPYETFAYRRMPFVLCNASATFQRCMTSIFHDMCKDFIGVFMDDFSVFGNSFDSCLTNLSKMLARCEETNLVLNWEKCHFMVKEGIVLGHKISKSGIEVDRAKIDRFIKDFSKIARPMTQLLIKDAKFVFSNECMQAYNILQNKLTSAPIIIAPDWNLNFKLMCDASDYAVGAVLGQRIDKKFRPIYYASKTMNDAQEHYTTTEKELLAVVYAFDKFHSYLIMSKTFFYTDHSALKYLFSKQDAKPRLIRWVLLLQEFTIEIKDKKGTKNLAVDHLSRLENLDLETLNEDAIRDSFLGEHLMAVQKFLSDIKPYIWDDPYLFKSCPDGIIRRCVFGKELQEILEHYHTGPTRGHYEADITAKKVSKSGFYWPTIFRDAARYIRDCDACQRAGNISSRNQMPLTNIIVSEVFDIWGIDFMGPFPFSRNNKYILVAVDYVSKWVEAEALPTNDARVVVKFLRKLFSRFGVPKALISDRGIHFCNSLLERTLMKYGVTHRLATPYHPQTSGQTENTNRAIKHILERTINGNRKEWADKLDDELWAFRTANKSPIRSTPFKIVYGKACHLLIKMEHKAYWALKNINLDLDTAGKHRTKRWHDAKIMDKEFHEGDEVLVFNSRLKLFPGNLKSRWYGPYTIIKVFPYGTVEVLAIRKWNSRSPRLVFMW
ncbi:putative nucleotidyltransferase, ribonuclease H [Tanacetum coccineum]